MRAAGKVERNYLQQCLGSCQVHRYIEHICRSSPGWAIIVAAMLAAGCARRWTLCNDAASSAAIDRQRQTACEAVHRLPANQTESDCHLDCSNPGMAPAPMCSDPEHLPLALPAEAPSAGTAPPMGWAGPELDLGFGEFTAAAMAAASSDWAGPLRLPVVPQAQPADETTPDLFVQSHPQADSLPWHPQTAGLPTPTGPAGPDGWSLPVGESGEHAPQELAGPPERVQHRLRALLSQARRDIRADHLGYYSWPTLRDLGLGVIVAAPLANTSMDEDFRDWYQQRVRTRGTDDLATFWKTFGEGQIFIPSFAVLAVVGNCCPQRPLMAAAGDYSGRVTRAYLVGTPPMLLMQFMLGAGRPDENSLASQWRPFQDNNGVSGHAFVGSVPFITVAQCVESPLLKGTFYVLSTFPAWSRINDDAHYLSQAMLGWWMGYLACRAVNQPPSPQPSRPLAGAEWKLLPLVTTEMTGLGITLRR